MIDLNDKQIDEPVSGKVTLPKIQLIVLIIILIGYPLFSTVMNLVNPSENVEIESRILQLYLPSLMFQALVFLSLILVILKDPLRQGDSYWSIAENIRSIGVRREDFSFTNLAIGVIFVFAAILILNMISNVIGYYGFFEAEDITYLLPRTPLEKVFWIALSISAGVTEELCFRGFIITRLSILTGSVWPGVIIGALSFGIGHLYQGWAGVVLIGIYGLMFGLLFIARGSLIPCIVAHVLQDILAAFAV
ncbi:MAG: CPBP family intramembrane metalloprotease [candidate division Zixibacteria bacterium]|nr:CPBP family intramembrane metalloprotease [candidate division Zixibacteria bacterium]